MSKATPEALQIGLAPASIAPSRSFSTVNRCPEHTHTTHQFHLASIPPRGARRLLDFIPPPPDPFASPSPSPGRSAAMGRRPFKCYRYQKNKPYPKSRFNRGVPGKPQHLSGGNLKQFIPLLCSRSLSLLTAQYSRFARQTRRSASTTPARRSTASTSSPSPRTWSRWRRSRSRRRRWRRAASRATSTW